MSFWDYLTAGKKYREADNERRSSDYSSGYSSPRRVRYKAYCKKCGAITTFTYSSRSEAVSNLQQGITGVNSNYCKNHNHLAEIEEVEE